MPGMSCPTLRMCLRLYGMHILKWYGGKKENPETKAGKKGAKEEKEHCGFKYEMAYLALC